MTKEEKQKAIDALKISAPVMELPPAYYPQWQQD